MTTWREEIELAFKNGKDGDSWDDIVDTGDNKPCEEKTPSDFEFLFIVCEQCGEKVKIGKNKGNHYTTDYPGEWLYDFLIEHSGCGINKIKLRWEE